MTMTEKEFKLMVLKKNLSRTDHIMSQITEAEQFHPEDVAELRAKYANVVIERIAWRKEIQELEKQR